MTLMTTRRLATIATVLLMVGLAGEGYGQNRIVCPNRDPIPGSCPVNQKGKTGDGNTTPADSIASTGNQGPAVSMSSGDPVVLDKGFVLRWEKDFEVGVKHGMSLDVRRIYSSTPNAADGFGISQSNSAGDGMFGLNWYCPYEQHLEGVAYIDDIYGGAVFVDERGGMRHFDYVNTNTWRSRLDQGAPLELTRTGTGSSAIYSLRGGDNSLRKFRSDGKIIELIPDANQPTVSLTFEYYPAGSAWNWDNNLWKVHAPGGDDRYLEFEYHTYGWNRKVYNAWMKTSTAAYKVATYWYDGNGYLQSAKGQGPGQTYWLFYEYGSFNPAATLTDPVAPLNASSAGAILGRVSHFTDGETTSRPIVAYTYGESFSNSASRQWSWDISGTTHQWRQTHTTNANPWNHTPTLYLGDGVPNVPGGQNDPATFLVTDYQCDLAQMSYGNTSDAMPPTNIFGPGQTSQGNGANKNRLPGSGQRYDGASWWKEWENIYNLTTQTGYSLSDPEYLAQHRLNEARTYWTAGAYNATTYTYHSNTVASGFWYKPIRITNPAGEYVDYEYYALGTADQSRLKAIVKSGLRTEYTYNAAGLVWKIKDVQYNTETVFTYDTRGNTTQISYPDGNVVTRTYNDFGQVLTETVSHLGTTTYTYSDSLPTSDPEYCLPPRLVEVEDANGQTTRYYYDSTGDITKVVDANNKATEMFYNRRGMRTQVKNPNGESVYYGYDVYERMTKFTDGRGKITTYNHDMFGRVIKETNPDGYFTTYTYTDNSSGSGCGSCSGGGASLVSRVVRQDGSGVKFRYDWAGRLTEVDYESIGAAGSTEVFYYYDAASRITSIYDTRLTLGDGNYIFSYDSGVAKTGRLERIQHPNGWAQDYYYDDSAASAHYRRLKAYRDVDGNITQYTYDSLGRQASLIDPYSATTSFTYATTSDTAFPVGAIKRVTNGNGTKTDYTYDSLGRTDRIDYLTPSNNPFDYIDLAYDPVGMITERTRKDGASWYKTVYTYDNAYRLSGETNRTAADVYQTSRTYGYDAGGNRSSMTIQNSASVNKTTTYAYGNRNQLASNTGYYREGTTDTGAMTYTWDAKGNMLTRTGQSYEWNEDNRMTRVWVSAGDPKTEILQKFYKYDSAGRRVLSHTSTNSQRTRHFFNGLTEEIRKVSLGTHADTSFTFWSLIDGTSASGWAQGVGSGGTVTSVDDAARFSKVLRFNSGGRFDRSFSARTERAFSFWFKHELYNHSVVLWATTSAGARRIVFKTGTGTDGFVSGEYVVHLGTGVLDGNWHRIERDLTQIVATQTPGVTYTSTSSISVWSSRCYIDDMRFSNTITVEHNVFGAGVVGHILRNRTTNAATGVKTDRWFHYDQVGSVISESDAAGALAQTHHQDAFGNTQAAWTTGLWGGDRAGWHHNTKELDGDTGLVYVFRRWFSPETGSFISRDTLDNPRHHRYAWGPSSPTVSPDWTGNAAFDLPKWDDSIQNCRDKRECEDQGGNCCDFVRCVIDDYYGSGGGGTMDPTPDPVPPGNRTLPPGTVVATTPEFGMNCMRDGGGSGHIVVIDSEGRICECTQKELPGMEGPHKTTRCGRNSWSPGFNNNPVVVF